MRVIHRKMRGEAIHTIDGPPTLTEVMIEVDGHEFRVRVVDGHLTLTETEGHVLFVRNPAANTVEIMVMP